MRSGRSWRKIAAVTMVATVVLAACGDDDDDTATSGAAEVSEPAGTTPAAASEDTTAATEPAATVAETTGPAESVPEATEPAETVAETTEAAAPVTTGGSLTVGIDGEAACYVPHLCSVSYGPGGIRFAVLENLVRPANNTDGWEYQLADSIEPNADFTQFTVTLKEGVQWSDGTPMTAGDIKTLFDTYVFAEGSTLRGNVAAIASTDAPDDQTVVFNLSTPQAPFPVTLTNIPIYKPVPGLEQTSIPIGTGPFVMESWEPNVQTVLKKNPLYYGTDGDGNQLPYLDEIISIPITSGDTRVNSLETGDINIAMSTDPLISASLRERSTAYEVGLNAGNGLFFNNSSPPTDDLRVRQALAYATNKEDIMAAIGGGEPRDEYYVPESEWYSDEASELTPGYDTEQAQTLLDEYINDPARSDGQPVGTPLTIDITTLQGAVTSESVAAIAQQQWGEVGVNVTITPKDQSTLIADAISGNFNVNYFGWATPHPYSLLTRNYGHWPETPTNYTHFNSDELLSIVQQMSVAGTPEEMDALIQQSNVVLAEGVPLIFVHSTPLVWGTNDDVGNVDLLPGNGFIEWTTLTRAD